MPGFYSSVPGQKAPRSDTLETCPLASESDVALVILEMRQVETREVE